MKRNVEIRKIVTVSWSANSDAPVQLNLFGGRIPWTPGGFNLNYLFASSRKIDFSLAMREAESFG